MSFLFKISGLNCISPSIWIDGLLPSYIVIYVLEDSSLHTGAGKVPNKLRSSNIS